MEFKSKLILGTAQFGMPYGLEKCNVIVNNKKLKKIIDCARNSKLNKIDTAINYGEAQKNIGKFDVNDFKIISKIPKLNLNKKVNLQNFIFNCVDEIFENLNVKKISALLMHSPEDLLTKNGSEYYNLLQKLKNDGLIERIGLSIHNFNHIKQILEKYKFDLIQLPFNIFDQRILNNNVLEYLKSKNIELHVRSIFLQGLLLMDSDQRPKQFFKWSQHFKLWDEYIKKEKISKLEACLSFVNSVDFIKGIIIGVKSEKQLKQIVNANLNNDKTFAKKLICHDLQLINPSNWNSN